jgi:ribonuclease E
MAKKILIDSSHIEETRVVVLKNENICEYDFEIKSRQDFKGNIYLAKITRVEPSLQAAFVEYGQDKQGFLPFNEIHIEYFSLEEKEKEELRKKEYEYREFVKKKKQERQQNNDNSSNKENPSEKKDFNKNIEVENEKNDGEIIFDSSNINQTKDLDVDVVEEKDDSIKLLLDTENDIKINTEESLAIENESNNSEETEIIELLDEAFEEEKYKKEVESLGSRYGYKIQDVIKKDQYLPIQIVKEERGNKGASMTTYLSIPGRYCVFMPNTHFDGGISKKINNSEDRLKIKEIIQSLDISLDQNIIIRTAGADKSLEEIKSDYNYVKVIWNTMQSLLKDSKHPKLLYEETNLIKRVIRDFVTKDVTDIIIDSEEDYKIAIDFAKSIAPDIVSKIKKYDYNGSFVSIFQQFKIEEEVNSLYSPVVHLRSGGYLVIHPTEALMTIDVNSGRYKGKHNVEETALKTNLEAAYEIARQIKLRDIGGLIVIDFIDMENLKNRNTVEKRMKESVKDDKARIQIGQISQFGLLELSRQRIKTSLVERSFNVCDKCLGIGYVRPVELRALQILRNLYLKAEKNKFEGSKIIIKMPTAEAFYILNQKRYHINTLEELIRANIKIECDDNMGFPFYEILEDVSINKNVPEAVSLLEKEIETFKKDNKNRIFKKDFKNKFNKNNKNTDSVVINDSNNDKMKNDNNEIEGEVKKDKEENYKSNTRSYKNNYHNKNKKFGRKFNKNESQPKEVVKENDKPWFKKILGL